jgi:hypothetical protein
MALSVAFLFVGTAASQDVGEGWDDAVATKLASDLAQTLRDAYEQSLKAPPQRTVLQQRGREAAQGVIRRARDLSEDYARKMRAGWSREASEPFFRVVADEVAHIWDASGDAVPAESAKPLVERLQKILDELRARYDAALSSG